MDQLIPIFPLETVVYPGDGLNLHIFEPRYQQLINDCAKKKMPFGIPAVVNRKIGDWGTLVELTQVANVQPDVHLDSRSPDLSDHAVAEIISGETLQRSPGGLPGQ